MKNLVLCTIIASFIATPSLQADIEPSHALHDDSVDAANLLLAVADQIHLLPDIKQFTVHKIEKGSMQDRYLYLLSGLKIGDEYVTAGTLRIMKTRIRGWHEYDSYEVDFLDVPDDAAQNFFHWRPMRNDSVGIANVMLSAIGQIVGLQNYRDLQVMGGEKDIALDREAYQLFGMEIIGHTSVIGGFTLLITQITNVGPNGIYRTYDVDYQGIRNNENFPLAPPVLVRS